MSQSPPPDPSQPPSVTVGAGTSWEQERVQSTAPAAVAAAEHVHGGGELTRVVHRTDQVADGAQPWTVMPRAEVERAGEAAFSSAYGVSGAPASPSSPLDPPVVLTGRMPEGGTFVTTEALAQYHSKHKLSTIEIVAAPDTVVTTGMYDLTKGPTYSTTFPPELQTLQASGQLPSQSNNPPTETMAYQSPDQPKQQPEAGPAPSSMGDSAPPPPPPPDLSQSSFGGLSQAQRDEFIREQPAPPPAKEQEPPSR